MNGPAAEPRALVTGATGFVGGAVAAALRAAGWDVHAVVRRTSDATRVASLSAAGCVLHVHDGTLDGLVEVVGEARPDCTWHLATRFIASHVPGDVPALVRDNVEFGAMLLEALVGTPEPAVVTAGTLWQQYDNAAYSPVSLYAATKQAFDVVAAYYAEVHRFRIVECLMTDTYGPSDARRKLLWHLRTAVRTGQPLGMSGDGGQYIDLMHVDDAVRALLIAGDRARRAAPPTNERWAVRPGHAVRVRELVELVGVAAGRPVPVTWGARPSRPREMTLPWTAGAPLPGWQAEWSLDAGLAQLVSGGAVDANP